MLWGESTEPDPAERWDGVDANVLLVALEGARRDGVLDHGEPFGEERGGAWGSGGRQSQLTAGRRDRRSLLGP